MVETDQQVARGIAKTPLTGGLLTQIPVVEDGELVGQQLRDGQHVAVDIGDHPDPHLVGDLKQRAGVQQLAVDAPVRLGRKRRDALGPPRHAEVVDAGFIEDAGDEVDELGAGHLQRGLPSDVRRHRPVDLSRTHGSTLPCLAAQHQPPPPLSWASLPVELGLPAR